MNKKNTELILDIIGLVCLVISLNLIGGVVIMLGWNLLAKLIGLNSINIWVGLLVSVVIIYAKPVKLYIKKALR